VSVFETVPSSASSVEPAADAASRRTAGDVPADDPVSPSPDTDESTVGAAAVVSGATVLCTAEVTADVVDARSFEVPVASPTIDEPTDCVDGGVDAVVEELDTAGMSSGIASSACALCEATPRTTVRITHPAASAAPSRRTRSSQEAGRDSEISTDEPFVSVEESLDSWSRHSARVLRRRQEETVHG